MRNNLLVLILFLFLCSPAGAETFGSLTTEDGERSYYGNYVTLSKFTLTEAGSVTKLTIRLKSSSGTHNAKGVIYDDNGVGAIASTNLGVTAAASYGTTISWVDLTFSTPIELEPGDYWIGFVMQSDSDTFGYEDEAGLTDRDNANSGGYANPSTFNYGGTYTPQQICIYATYTPSGGTVTRRSPMVIDE